MKNTNWLKFAISVASIGAATLTAVAGSDALGLSDQTRDTIVHVVDVVAAVTMFFVNPANKAATAATIGAVSRFASATVPANRRVAQPQPAVSFTTPVTSVPGLGMSSTVDPLQVAQALEALAATTRKAHEDAQNEADKQAKLAQATELEAQAQAIRDSLQEQTS